MVGSAIGTLSRLRRAPVVDDAPPSATSVGERLPAGSVFSTASNPTGPAPIETTTDRPVTLLESDGRAERDRQQERAQTRPATSRLDLPELAALCTRLGRVEQAAELPDLLAEAAVLLDASGLIIWVWDGPTGELRPALVHGYSDRVVAQLPGVRQDDDNATAAAFRAGQMCAIGGSDHQSAALAVPLLAPGGCAGVLALELHPGVEPASSVAIATILAALLAQLIGGVRAAEARPAPDATPVAAGRHSTREAGPARVSRQRRRATQAAPAAIAASAAQGASARRAGRSPE
jgi:hypothetical protein